MPSMFARIPVTVLVGLNLSASIGVLGLFNLGCLIKQAA
jgi:hypothetical protein